jgi:hypothetical protein
MSCAGLIARPTPRSAAWQGNVPLKSQAIEAVTLNDFEES